MEARIRILFLIAMAFVVSGCGSLPFTGEDEVADKVAEVPEQVIEPEVDRRDVRPPKIDTEDFEVGAYTGLMSVEDFGVNSVYGIRLAYHITEGLFVEGALGRTDTEETSYERLSGAAQILTDDERKFTYYNVSLGYNLLPGEAFVGRGRAFAQALYLIAGLGSTDFAGDDRFTVNFGFGYRFLVNDAIAIHADVRDHLFDIDILGEEKTAHNIEGHVGLTIFF